MLCYAVISAVAITDPAGGGALRRLAELPSCRQHLPGAAVMQRDHRSPSLVLALAPGGCGGEETSAGSKCPASGSALTSGTVVYSSVASNIVDSCHTPPLTAAEISGDYTITADSNCAVTVQGSSGNAIGQGTATSGTFQLGSTEVVSEANAGGNCQYRRTKASSATIADDKTVIIQYSATNDNFMSLPGKNCPSPVGGSCSIGYTLTMTKQ